MKKNLLLLFVLIYIELHFIVLRLNLKQKWWRLQIITKSLFYNEFLNWSYVCDILLEPMFWFVENFTACLGPVSIFIIFFNLL